MRILSERYEIICLRSLAFLFWAFIPAYFLMRISGRGIFADLLRPFLVFILLNCAIFLLRSNAYIAYRACAVLLSILNTLACFVLAILYDYFRRGSGALTKSDIRAVLQTDMYEAREYLIEHFLSSSSLMLGVACLILSVLYFFCLFWVPKKI